MFGLAYYLITILGCGYAIWHGSRSERVGGIVYLTGSLATSLMGTHSHWEAFELNIFLIDLVVLVGFWSIALTSNRFWPYWAAGWQLVGIFTHIQKAILPGISSTPYGLLSMFLAYPILALIVVSAALHQYTAMKSELEFVGD